MSSSIQKTPHSYTLLHAQCDLLRSKGKHDWAVKLARQAVNCAPSEFVTWEKLTECWIDLGEFENALLTLNSCPMFTFNGRDMHRNLTPARVHLPFLKPIGEILPDRIKTEDDEVSCSPIQGMVTDNHHCYLRPTQLSFVYLLPVSEEHGPVPMPF